MQRIDAVTTSIPGSVCNFCTRMKGKRCALLVEFEEFELFYSPLNNMLLTDLTCIINSLETTYLVDKLVCSFVNSYHILLLNLYNAFRLFKKSLVHF